jgi:hypothetical protein
MSFGNLFDIDDLGSLQQECVQDSYMLLRIGKA